MIEFFFAKVTVITAAAIPTVFISSTVLLSEINFTLKELIWPVFYVRGNLKTEYDLMNIISNQPTELYGITCGSYENSLPT